MGLGGFSIDVDHALSLYEELVDGEGRARKVHLLFYDAGGNLVVAPMILQGVVSSEEGMTLTGCGVLWYLGLGAVGPMIVDREYVSGKDKLGNGSFLLGDLDWRRPAEGSLWTVSSGAAACAGGLVVDDVFQSDEPFKTRPGHSYLVTAKDVTGAGRLRVRAVFTGRFNPPDILVNGSFDLGAFGWILGSFASIQPSGGRSGPASMRIAPITKPQLFNFAAGPANLGSSMAFSGGVLTAGPNPRPDYIADPGFETLTGWSDEIGPPTRPMSDDINLVSDPANAADGSGVMVVGPVTPHQVFVNADYGTGSGTTIPNWYQSSTDSDPHLGIFELDPAEGNNGTQGVRTTGWSTAGRAGPETIKYLRATSANTGGVVTYDVLPGEQYRAEAYFKCTPGSEGQALISLMIPHPTVAGHDQWFHSSEKLEGTEMDDMRWFRATIASVTIPPNRFDLNALVEIRNHGLGYWYVDTFTMTRIRGNRAQSNSDSTYPVTPGTRYRLGALVRTGDEMQVGSVRIGVVLTGQSVDPRVIDVGQDYTDFVWTYVPVDFTPEDGYTTARPFVAGLDIVGGPAYVDNIQLTKMSNNTDTSTWAPVAVVADQRYLFQADVESLGAMEGSLTVGVVLSGPGVENEYHPLTLTVRGNAGVNALSKELRPPPGYDAATLYAESTDVIGGSFRVYRATLTKMDNNSDTSTGAPFSVVPERTYRWVQAVHSDANLQRGTVRLSVRCTRTGHADVVFDSSSMSGTDGDWKFIDFSFTPPSGHNIVIPSIVGTDVEGGYWHLDDGTVRDTDASTAVFDSPVDSPSGTDTTVVAVAPEGAEDVRVALVAEAGSGGWTVDAVTLQRTGVTPATGEAIVDDLLNDPATGLPLAVGAGTITCPDVIPEDWEITHQHNRQALDTLCDVVYSPPLEHHVNVSVPPTIDVGPPEVVFDDHHKDAATPFILASTDVDVGKLPPSRIDMTERADEVMVAGTERQTVNGRPTLITASAQVGTTPQVDWNQNPIHRTRNVSEATVDHRGYAQALADDLAEEEADPPVTLTFTLYGAGTRPAAKVGDWIYLDHPDAGFHDPANPVNVDGQTVFPQRTRILSRGRSLGPSHSIVVRREDGSTFALPGINWSTEDATVLTVGERRPDWQRNPSGPSAGVQYLRDRLARPR